MSWWKRPAVVATAAGTVTSGVVLFFLIKKKAADFETRGRALRVSGGAADQVRQRLLAYASTRGQEIAQQAGQDYLGTTYGLTQERIARISSLVRSLSG